MIKIPGTPEGLPAIQQLISEGININITLLFSQKVYVQVTEAYLAGLEKFAGSGGDVSRMASVASFFISRIDTLADSEIETRLKKAKDAREQAQLKSLLGKVAIANGKQTYQLYQESGFPGSTDATSTVGEHQHQESCVPRRSLR